jgi:valyl-tRNA synthetase
MNVPPAATAPLIVVGADTLTRERIGRHQAAVRRLARIDEIKEAGEAPRGAAQIVVGEATWSLPLGNLIDLSTEEARLKKAIAKAAKESERLELKLSNEKFVANADPEVVATERAKRDEYRETLSKLRVAINRVREAR